MTDRTRNAHLLQKEAELRQKAKELGTEVVTPLAAAELFARSMPTVREAARQDRIETALEVHFSEKPVRLYRLASCIDCWGHPDPTRLEAMRSNGHLMYVGNQDGRGGLTYNVLHVEPLVRQTTATD